MTRLWDKGTPLDDRCLIYTAGEDYGLDERLVRYDVRASIAHAEMLHAQKLLSSADLEEIRKGLTALADEHARGIWHIELTDEDGQTALEWRLTERIGAAGGGACAPGPFTERPGPGRHPFVSAGCHRRVEYGRLRRRRCARPARGSQEKHGAARANPPANSAAPFRG